jgi:hypothetical protein
MTSAGPTPTPPYLVRVQELPRVMRSLPTSDVAARQASALTELTRPRGPRVSLLVARQCLGLPLRACGTRGKGLPLGARGGRPLAA